MGVAWVYFVRQVCGGDAGGGKLKRMVQISGTGGTETKETDCET